jgi:hypothetical protein
MLPVAMPTPSSVMKNQTRYCRSAVANPTRFMKRIDIQ